MQLHQLVYCSRPFGFDGTMLDNILVSARHRNAAEGITGALVCRNDIFLQWLEGHAGKVENLFARIARDDRHVEIQVLIRRPSETRLFEKWSMLHDPYPTKLWTPQEVHDGAALRASEQEVQDIFVAVADAAAVS